MSSTPISFNFIADKKKKEDKTSSLAMAVVVKTPPNLGNINLVEMEDEDDLFEIDLEAVNSIPPPRYHWGSRFTNSPGTALFANCLLPVADVSSAIPAASMPIPMPKVPVQPAQRRRREFLPIPKVAPLGELLQLPYSRAVANYSWK